MAKKNIGATLSLNQGNFFTNIKSAVTGTNQLKTATTSATGDLKKMGSQSANTGGSLANLATKVVGVVAAYASIKQVVGFMKDCVTAANESTQANARLENMMGNVTGTTAAQIDAVRSYASELQRLTVLEDDAVISGSSQLAAFKLQGDTIKKLMPALGDLAVGQHGVNVTGEQMQQTASLIGKAMTGNVGALKRVGVVLTDAQQQILKTGTESQKTQVIIDALGSSYGGLAAKMADTPEGRIIQLKNAFGDMKEEIGGALYPTITSVLGWVAGKIPMVQGVVTTAIDGISTSLTWVKDNILPPPQTAFSAVWDFGVSAFNNIKTAVENNAPAFEGVKNMVVDVKDKLFQAFEYCKPAINWVKDTGLPMVVDILGGVLNAATGVYNFFSNNWSLIAPVIGGITASVIAYKVAVIASNAVEAISAIAKTGLVGATAAEVTALGLSSGAMGIYSTVTGIATTVTGAFGAVMAFVTSPIGIVVLAIGALIAIGILLWQNWDAVCAWIGGVWEGIKQTAVTVWNGICDFFVAWWPYIFAVFTGGLSLVVGFVINNWDAIKNTTAALWNGITGFLSGAWSAISNTAINVFNGIKTAILNVWNGIVSGIKGAINAILGGINGLIRGFVSGVNGLINGVNKVTGAIGIPAIPTFTAPQIPMLAKGGDIVTSGRVLVGERGPEYLDLPKGARVSPLGKENSTDNNSGLFAGIKSAVVDACEIMAAAVKGFVRDIAGGFKTFNAEPVPISELLKPVADSILRQIEAVIIKPAPVPDIPKLAMDGITRPSKAATDDKRPNAPEPRTEPKPPPEPSRPENHITINIYADGKSSDEIVDDLMPKLKLALANL